MSISKKDIAVGFIGTGVMGKSMAANLMKAGYRTIVYNRTKAKAEELIKSGAIWKDNVAEVAREANIIITMVGYPRDVEEVYFGKHGIIENARKDSYLIDMTTSSPSLAKKIYDQAKTKGLYALDAPVSGGDIGAREAKLSIMVGGDEDVFQTVKPLFEVMGKNIMLLGGAGAGQYTKMCNQIAIASNMMGVCEAIVYAKKSGLDPALVLKSIESGAAGSWSLSNYGPRMIAENYSPGFYIKHFIKDMRIAIESAEEMRIKLPGLELACSLYEELAKKGEENSGTHALIKYYITDTFSR
ncbi:MAG: NAD(P)-dependent oxidoreductase [Thermoanaerobacterales bacterium]|nr:NAD(P)-dependent oxidoreductase [Thermoanaerobacterales bacterium]